MGEPNVNYNSKSKRETIRGTEGEEERGVSEARGGVRGGRRKELAREEGRSMERTR